MTNEADLDEPAEGEQQPRRRWRKRRWAARIVAGLIFLAALLVAGMAALDTDIGHRFVADRIAALKPANGLRFKVGRIDGSLYSNARISDLAIYDAKGLVLRAPVVKLDWRPLAWLDNRLSIEQLTAKRATLYKLPELQPTGRQGPILPGFDIRVERFAIETLTIDEKILGKKRTGHIRAAADIRSGRARIDLTARIDGSDRLLAKIDVSPDDDRFNVNVAATGATEGLFARLTGIAKPLALRIGGDGSWTRWAGAARMVAGDVQLADLRMGNRQGEFGLAGTLNLQSITHGKVQRLSAPRLSIRGKGTLDHRRLSGTLDLKSAAMTVESSGTIDLAKSLLRDVRIRARLHRVAALFPGTSGRNVEIRTILDGPFDTAKFDYRIDADRFAVDNTGFEGVHAAGQGRLSKAPVTVPLRLVAKRVTGVGDVAGGILRNLRLDGQLKVTPDSITGNGLDLRSDKLRGKLILYIDLKTGRFVVSMMGGLHRYLIPGLGLVEVDSDLRATPVPGGGIRVAGRGSARLIRLDNGFFRSLMQGLPRITTRLERGPDMVLRFDDMVLTSPALTLRGKGYRRRDGSFHIEAVGEHQDYGPLTLVLDGKIDHPTLDIRFARPNDALGLKQVVTHLDPTDQGYSFTGEGTSRLGPFTIAGDILLPPGGTAQIAIQKLAVSGTEANGTLDIVEGGFAGKLAVAGGGLSGALTLAPQSDMQRISGSISARDARLGPTLQVARGKSDFDVLLDPEGTQINATAIARGVQGNGLMLERLNGTIRMRGGDGLLNASLAGSRGRNFAIQTQAEIHPDLYVVTANGTLDGKPIRLTSPARLARDGDGWRLSKTTLSFAGGQATMSGSTAGESTSFDASLDTMPLSVLDIGYPGLGLGGSASGTLHYAAAGEGGPTGKANLTVRGLTRSGLVLSSTPVDLGLAALLQPGKFAARAVAVSNGKTIGRGQIRLSPGGAGSLIERLGNAPMFAQLRFDGPADTLWRLSGIELFDLTGPVAIGADFGGSLNDPRIRGSVRMRGGRIQSATTGTVLADLNASGRFDGSRLVIDDFAGNDGRDGKVSGSGSFEFSRARGVGIDLSVQAEKARLINRDDIAATVTGPLRIRSSGAGGEISGDVQLVSSRYQLGRATAATEIPQIETREINRPFGADIEDTPTRPWKLDLDAKAKGAMMVRGLGLDSEWSADLHIGGEPTNPAITGRADLIRGDYDFAGRTFDLDRGVIRFSGTQPPNPALDIAANADTQDINATIRVTGTSARPEISFTSTPALPEDELLSRLLFGTSITNLSAPEALQLASAVAALQDGGNGLDPINAVRRAAGLDRLRILPADPQTGQATALAAGKYLTRRTYVEIISDGQGYSATRAEFQVTRWLSLLSSVSTIGRQSVNVRVSKDY
ncbi:translocation/assembly module TamB domain-containing protein [Stakelama pacifica]|uniref:Autotransporter secretion inner membrane protein TamB n=1 Tax=Stakelama pacifica TaxID=517720 RepID=A0A4R6FC91_9SPHN|nr:translocation/assembly module TamB domain-containing protein [Stakelama pacifica]TDN78786.1 autotransporter secretion inner membrane protein TamB [Stakelama pacifica]GGO99110.1 translocation/assembly module TamB [Stakelama pacifica]